MGTFLRNLDFKHKAYFAGPFLCDGDYEHLQRARLAKTSAELYYISLRCFIASKLIGKVVPALSVKVVNMLQIILNNYINLINIYLLHLGLVGRIY